MYIFFFLSLFIIVMHVKYKYFCMLAIVVQDDKKNVCHKNKEDARDPSAYTKQLLYTSHHPSLSAINLSNLLVKPPIVLAATTWLPGLLHASTCSFPSACILLVLVLRVALLSNGTLTLSLFLVWEASISAYGRSWP